MSQIGRWHAYVVFSRTTCSNLFRKLVLVLDIGLDADTQVSWLFDQVSDRKLELE